MIPILMDSSKSLTALAADQTNGLGALSECTSCVAKEERNGAFTLELKLPQGAKHISEVTVGGVIKAKAREAGDPQLFRISKITKPMQGVVTVYANHISYDLNKTSVLPFSSTGIVTTLSTMKTKMQGGDAFTLSTDIVNTSSSFSNKVPQSARALFGGQQGSLLDVFGGEYLFDNLQVSLLANRGNDNGVTLRYGKNITDLSQEENIENTYTAIQPYVVDSNENAVLGDLLTVVQSAEPKIMNLDLSNKFSGNDTPTVAQINAAAQQYAEANNIGVPRVSIKVSFVALWQTEEYKDIAPLERVSLCDTVTVVFEKLGVNAKAKVVSTTYDTLRERYTEIEIGDARSTLASTISGINQDSKNAVANASGFLDNTIQQFTSLIANGLGLFITREAVGETGGYKYYLHNRPTLADSQYQWTFNSNGFAVSQDYGASWRTGIDSDGNAVFNSIAANRINAMSITGSEITGGLITGAEIDSGDMYWFKGTANQGLMHEATWSWSSTNHTGVELLSGAWRLNTGNAYHIMYQDFIQFRVGNTIGRNTVTISPNYISMFQNVNGSILQLADENSHMAYGSYGMVMVKSSGVTIRTRSHSSASMSQHDIEWRNITVGGQTITVLAQR